MDGLSLTFDSPWYLLLLGVVPFFWRMAYRSMASMGRGRAIAAFCFRTVVAVSLILALAEMQTRQTRRGVSVIYLLDQSLSIPAAERSAMFEYVARAVEQHRNASRGDRVGVIVFGREALVEVAPIEDDLGWLRRSEAAFPNLEEATNLADGLELALAVFPHDSARRVVVVTDGNENIGAARQVASQFAVEGIGIDVVPIRVERENDVAVEKIVLPAVIQRGETVEARVVVDNDVPQGESGSTNVVRGRLRVVRRVGAEAEVLSEQNVELTPGKNVLSMPHTIDVAPGFFTYEAQFVPGEGILERTRQNNRATTFAEVRGKGQVLLIEGADTAGEFDHLAERLREADIQLEVRSSAQPFSTLAELQQYDAVVLANVARTSGEDAIAIFSDGQIEMLVRNTHMGCGLVMLGGPNSFGAGGWANTKLEEASPVDFAVKNAKVVPAGALALVIDKSGSMQGEKIVMSRRAAMEAVRVLGAKDHVGVVAFDGIAQWVVRMHKIGSWRDDVARRIARLGAGGGTNMFPGMSEGFRALQSVEAAVKHMIVLTDGRTNPGDFERLAGEMREANISVSTVAIGTDADRQLLSNIARRGGGKFYHVVSPKAIPRIFVKEALRVARPLVYEREQGFTPQLVFPHEVLRGIDGPLPPITGFVLTDVKDNPLVEVALRSPQPSDARTSTLLASWTYGLGRFVVLTTDAGSRWASAWTQWDQYDALFTQIVRWAMRPRGQEGNLLVATEVDDGTIKAIVTALDEKEKFVNFLGMTCFVTTPDLQSLTMPMDQVAPGRYVGELPAKLPGNYFLTVAAGPGRGIVRTGVNVPSSAEFKDRDVNRPLLQALAAQKPDGGEPGLLAPGDLLQATADDLTRFDAFRPTLRPAVRLQDAWPALALIAACLFFLDVLNRRVVLNPTALLSPVLDYMRRRKTAPSEDERIERLRNRKAAIDREIEQRRAATRFEPTDEVAVVGDGVDHLSASGDSQRATAAEPEKETPSYTSRLLEAKRRTRERRSGE